jgi:Ulp1 family protease
VNFGDEHWTCVMVCQLSQEIKYYDSIPTPAREGALRELSTNLIDGEDAIFPDYMVVAINNPIQADEFSCGLFVCLMCWREVDKAVSRNVDGVALTIHRVEMLHLLLRCREIQ